VEGDGRGMNAGLGHASPQNWSEKETRCRELIIRRGKGSRKGTERRTGLDEETMEVTGWRQRIIGSGYAVSFVIYPLLSIISLMARNISVNKTLWL